MTDQLDYVVVGAGVIGLAIGRSLALAGRDVVVLEAEPDIGTHTSSRNSEVIHAGLYYPEGSLKAKLCVQGKAMLYDYCEARRIPYIRLGKLLVASGRDESSRLEAIRAQASRNGVRDLKFLTARQAKSLEPHVECDAALLSPSTGIIDSHSLMLSLQGDIEAHGGTVVLRSKVQSVAVTGTGFSVRLEDSDDQFACHNLVNAAGLYAATLARRIDGMPSTQVPDPQFAIGHYFTYPGKSPFNHLIYPVPVDGGLGIHATNDLAGNVRFGPDIEWIETIDYSFDSSRKKRFGSAIRRYFPALDASKLAPAYTGIRPKLAGPGADFQDFVIQCQGTHGVSGLVNLFGIESPGLTACLAVGDYVTGLMSR